jgi:hypothetical protein
MSLGTFSFYEFKIQAGESRQKPSTITCTSTSTTTPTCSVKPEGFTEHSRRQSRVFCGRRRRLVPHQPSDAESVAEPQRQRYRGWNETPCRCEKFLGPFRADRFGWTGPSAVDLITEAKSLFVPW